ncbi:hypothetical protein QI301_12295 [Staphylococcus saprophyticus]|uniref:hypothetical protein n=1 Tax=Staphylococcus saprophyticus TaxID=29385 RepID=UPI000853B097|nr:hypothetical protein [Staphylococcus saprophyticus]MDW3871229.1 hypothetical protein [Staphylococcus saprophyticus]MDW4026265.1 hypothetical protein [Staphylococcus saprophyticus]OEK40153.1 hypothetical protein ASS89_08670 [Staphylococcus saprophyticus]
MSYERTTKDSVEYIANKFAENPGHFAATILRMYWDMEKQRDQYKAERNSLIDDLSWYKAKVSRLERHNKDLRLQSDTYFEQWQGVKKELQDYEDDYEMVTNNCIYWEDKAHWLEDESSKYINLLSEFSQHVGNKPSSSTYKYFRAKLDELGIKEGE